LNRGAFRLGRDWREGGSIYFSGGHSAP